jgi:hypothetical protein
VRSFLVAIASAVAVSGCTASTGVLPAGPDTFTLTERASPILGGSDTAEKDALTKANDYCAQQGRKFVPGNMGQVASLSDANKTNTGYAITFKCLLPNDPALAAYQQAPPGVVIQQRQPTNR